MRGSIPKILVIGPMSYVGGINVHIKRLSRILLGGVEFNFWDDAPYGVSVDATRSIRKISSVPRFFREACASDVVHIHSGNWLLRILLVLACRLGRVKTVVTLHSYRLSGFKRFLSNMAMKFADSVICVNEDIAVSAGLSSAYVKEAFIPSLDDVDVPLPDEVDSFIGSHDASVLVCANAYRLTRYEGKDLYGLDQCIELARRLKREGNDAVIVFVVGTVMSSDDIYWSAEKCIREEGLGDVIKIYPKSLDFLTLMRRADIVLRPTLSDGDALTVREALFFGKPVIASDVVPRPAGTIVYTSESADDLHAKIKGVITQLSHGQEFRQTEAPSLDSYRNFYLGVYRKCFN